MSADLEAMTVALLNNQVTTATTTAGQVINVTTVTLSVTIVRLLARLEEDAIGGQLGTEFKLGLGTTSYTSPPPFTSGLPCPCPRPITVPHPSPSPYPSLRCPAPAPPQVPSSWARAAYPSLKPLASWVKDLHARTEFMASWLYDGEPHAFWLPGFFFPQVRLGLPATAAASALPAILAG